MDWSILNSSPTGPLTSAKSAAIEGRGVDALIVQREYVSILRGGFGGGTLISAGGGVRADIGQVGLQFETAFPVHTPENDNISDGPKINLQLGLDF